MLGTSSNVTVVLVNQFLDRNVGSVARSMLNFGLKDLVLVDPQYNHHSQVSRFPVGVRPSDFCLPSSST
jgi:tRNA C32,U32 (ribose-2'-O)-methylase TrmJ